MSDVIPIEASFRMSGKLHVVEITWSNGMFRTFFCGSDDPPWKADLREGPWSLEKVPAGQPATPAPLPTAVRTPVAMAQSETTNGLVTVTVGCNDGTFWRYMPCMGWGLLPPIPQPEEK